MTCKNTAATGCKCAEHNLGLATYSPDVVAYLQALANTNRPRSRHLAAVPIPVIKALPFGDHKDHQPWQPRPARKRAA